MDPFWTSIYDNGKDRRYGALFFMTLLALLGVLAVVGIMGIVTRGDTDIAAALTVAVAIIAASITIALWRWFRERKQRGERLKYSTLSRDELAKARSKLKKQMNPVRFRQVVRPSKTRPVLRAPDTDLKY